MKVAVLGAGPTGLIAAWTARLHGAEVHVFTKEDKPSVISGAQVLHEPIQGLGEDGVFPVAYMKQGTREGYAKKIYGREDAPCSWDLYEEGLHSAWPMVLTYSHLWGAFMGELFVGELDYQAIDRMMPRYDHVFSTIPLTQVMREPEFDIWEMQVIHTMTAHGGNPDENWIIYHGDEQTAAYRSSQIKGVQSVEFPGDEPPAGLPGNRFRRVVKPLDVVGGDDTRKDIAPEGLHLLGRYGEWRKGVLAHHAQDRVREVLRA